MAHIAGYVFVALWTAAFGLYGAWCIVSPASAFDFYKNRLRAYALWDLGSSDDPSVKIYTRMSGALLCTFGGACLYLVIRAMLISVQQIQ